MNQPLYDAQLVFDYLELIENLSDTRYVLKNAPQLTFPQSLLPVPKSILKQNLEAAIKAAAIPGNELQLSRLQQGMWYLKRFR